MAVDDCNLDNGDLQDLILDNIEKGYCDSSDNWLSSSFSESPKSQLCVPPDPIEDLDWFPTFGDDFISLNDVEELIPEQPNYCFVYDKPNQPAEKLPFMDFPVMTVTPESHDKNYEISGEPRLLYSALSKIEANQQNKEEVMNLKHQNHSERRKQRAESLPHGFMGSATKKARTKNHQKPKCAVPWVKKMCSHCKTEETPQWRTGPLGPKTLCNACGVRFKSGRLVPEYRPATSPTFDSGRHSNYHKNIMKMRSSH